jgi:hypothetical protein
MSNVKFEKFENFEGDAVRTDGKMGSSISTYEFRGHFWRGGKGGERVDLGIKLGWPAKQEQISPQGRDKPRS